jgi:hypothetical protein
MPYGIMTTLWSNWLYSERPDYFYGDDILFLRANSVQVKTGDAAYTITSNSAIFIPVYAVQYHIGATYRGTKIESEVGLRHVIRSEIRQCKTMWAHIQPNENPTQPIVNDLTDYYAESPLFSLRVSEKSPLRDKLESQLEPGTYNATIGGYFILIHDLVPGTYRIRFGYNGVDSRFADAYYEIHIEYTREKYMSATPPPAKLPGF